MPPYRRLLADSKAACEKLVNVRSATAAFSDGSVNVNRSPPKNFARTAAAAPLNVLCPDVYAGKLGVVISGVQAGSAVVLGLPSLAASRMPVIGRQKLYSYLASQQEMAASASARFNRANSRAFSTSVFPAACATI